MWLHQRNADRERSGTRKYLTQEKLSSVASATKPRMRGAREGSSGFGDTNRVFIGCGSTRVSAYEGGKDVFVSEILLVAAKLKGIGGLIGKASSGRIGGFVFRFIEFLQQSLALHRIDLRPLIKSRVMDRDSR